MRLLPASCAVGLFAPGTDVAHRLHQFGPLIIKLGSVVVSVRRVAEAGLMVSVLRLANAGQIRVGSVGAVSACHGSHWVQIYLGPLLDQEKY